MRTFLFDHILIQTNNICTKKCHFCLFGMPDVKIDNAVMSDELFKKIVDELGKLNYAGRISLFEINEPLTDKRITSMVKYVKTHVPQSWQLLVTNGDLLTSSLATELVEAGVDYLVINSYAISNYIQTKKMLRELPAKTINHVCSAGLFDPKSATDNRGGNIPGIEKIKKSLNEPCRRVNHVLYIKPDGQVSACFGDLLSQNIVGNTMKQTLSEIWFGPTFKALRKKLNLGYRKGLKPCESCNVGNWVSFVDSRKVMDRELFVNQSLAGAIVGASNSARLFYSYLRKYAQMKYLVSQKGYLYEAPSMYSDLTVTNEFEKVLNDPLIDFVFVANSNNLHYSTARTALEHDKHVLIEKPMTLETEHLNELASIASARNLCLGGIFQMRFLRTLAWVKQTILSGKLGRLIFVNARLLLHAEDGYYVHGRGSYLIDGGGVLIKQAIHYLDLMLNIAGPAKAWHGYCGNELGKRETEDTIVLSLDFNEGRGVLQATLDSAGNKIGEIEVIGTKGRIVFAADDTIISSTLPVPLKLKFRTVNIYDSQINNYINAIRKITPLVVTPETCRDSIEIIRDVYRSNSHTYISGDN